MSLDYIIVGGGLMGSLLATELMRYKQRILLFEAPHIPSASTVAAGMYNPITGQAMRKSPQVDKLFPVLKSHYESLEKLWNVRLHYPLPLYRPFASAQEQTRWMKAYQEPIYQPYVSKISTQPQASGQLDDRYGGLYLHETGFVDVSTLLQAAHSYFQKHKVLNQQTWVWDRCHLTKKGLSYEGLHAKAVISCEGIYASINPFLKDFPLHALKGEIIDLSLEKTTTWPTSIYNREVFMLPHPAGYLRVGSTYEHIDIPSSPHQATDGKRSSQPQAQAQTLAHMFAPSRTGRKQLLDKTKKLFKPATQVIKQQAGLRCCTRDRRPWVGAHPQYPSLYICSGLGTKGISWAPYISKTLRAWLLEGQTIPSFLEVSSQRLGLPGTRF